jgi:hypothetical protein
MRALLTCGLGVLLLGGGLPVGQGLEVTPLARDGHVLVSFRMTGAFTREVLGAIHSGMTVTFVYNVELKRASAWWLDRTIAAASVTASVRYDNLTRKYHVTRRSDGRIERAQTLDREDAVRVWLTEFEKMPLFSSGGLEPNAEYYLRIRAHSTPRNASFVWPWEGTDVSRTAQFTFIQ